MGIESYQVGDRVRIKKKTSGGQEVLGTALFTIVEELKGEWTGRFYLNDISGRALISEQDGQRLKVHRSAMVKSVPSQHIGHS